MRVHVRAGEIINNKTSNIAATYGEIRAADNQIENEFISQKLNLTLTVCVLSYSKN